MDSQSPIPKVIHYFWFGLSQKPKLVLDCIESWKRTCPSFTIKEWNESNYDVAASPFSARMHQEKKWAFVADYARLDILEKEGGVYLDTDMELVKDISPLLMGDLVLGEESPSIISAGMIGASPHHPYIQACKYAYSAVKGLPPTIPVLMTNTYKALKGDLGHVTVYPPVVFYPYSQETISSYKKENLGNETYGVHLWNYSWGHPLLRFLNHFPLYHRFKRILGILGIKKMIKKIAGLS